MTCATQTTTTIAEWTPALAWDGGKHPYATAESGSLTYTEWRRCRGCAARSGRPMPSSGAAWAEVLARAQREVRPDEETLYIYNSGQLRKDYLWISASMAHMR